MAHARRRAARCWRATRCAVQHARLPGARRIAPRAQRAQADPGDRAGARASRARSVRHQRRRRPPACVLPPRRRRRPRGCLAARGVQGPGREPSRSRGRASGGCGSRGSPPRAQRARPASSCRSRALRAAARSVRFAHAGSRRAALSADRARGFFRQTRRRAQALRSIAPAPGKRLLSVR